MDFLTTMYPQDKANHYMRGSFVAGVAAAALIVVVALIAKRELLPVPPPITWALLAAAIVGWVAAFAAGRVKERLDARANEEAAAKNEPPPHGVEVADWQFTHWGAFPVALPLAVAQFAVWSL